LSEPRIPPRPTDEWDAEVDDALGALRPPGSPPREAGAARPSSNIIGIFAQYPALAKAFFTFNSHLFRSSLSARHREILTVRVGWLRHAEYEWAQHVRMAKQVGLTDEEVEAINVGPDSPVWGPEDGAVLRAVDELVNDRYISDDTWKQLAGYLDRKQVMDLAFTVGAYDLLGMAMNTFGVQLDPGLPEFPPEHR
jgi:4-carboxymuconolactone decarboxylase